MKKNLILSLATISAMPLALAQAQTEAPIVIEKQTIVTPQTQSSTAIVVPTEQPSNTGVVVQTRAVSDETLAVLRDIRRLAPEREREVQAALKIDSDAEAQLVLKSILTDAQDDIRAAEIARLDLEVVNRTAQQREEYVTYITRRLGGEVAVTEAPVSFRSRVVTAPVVETTETVVVPTETVVVEHREPRFYGPGRRVITYRTHEEIPPVLLASAHLQRVEVTEVGSTPFASELTLVHDMPAEYIAPSAYAVSYVVDPDTEITRSDILFEQGTTDFADAYSHDIVADLAMAMRDPALAGQAFIIEGHASAEGDYSTNLRLSQARAERIAREMIRFGVSETQLVPVGYGVSEAVYPASAPEELRSQDRRVTVFALTSY